MAKNPSFLDDPPAKDADDGLIKGRETPGAKSHRGRLAEGIWGPSVKSPLPQNLLAQVSGTLFAKPMRPDLGTAIDIGNDADAGPAIRVGNALVNQPARATVDTTTTGQIAIPGPALAPGEPAAPNYPDPTPVERGPWMGPSLPMRPTVGNPADVVGREFAYQAGVNLGTSPRSTERISFEMLRGLAYGYDLVSILIETRKSQMAKVTGQFLPKQQAGQEVRAPADDRCNMLAEFFAYPDGRLPFVTWKQKLLDDLFCIDAPTLYVRRTLGGAPCRLEIMDGSLIIPRLDTTGRMPDPPEIAYTAVNSGAPVYNYRADELIYFPRNPRPGKIYGYGPVEQIVMTVLIGLRRESQKYQYYATGNIPDALLAVPQEWNSSDVRDFQARFDARMRDPVKRFGRITFVPGGGQPVFTRTETGLFGPFDEWLARICCYAFDLPSLPFVAQQNRATAETANEQALSEGLESVMIWWKSLLDHVVTKIFGWSDIEYVFDDVSDIKPAEVVESLMPAMAEGLLSGDELRTDMGRAPIGLRPYVKGIGPMGFMFVDDMVKASDLGLTLYGPTGPPPPAQPQLLGPDGQPLPPQLAGPGAAPAIGGPAPMAALPAPAQRPPPDLSGPLSGVPPELLAAVGLGPDGPEGRGIDVTTGDQAETDAADPLVRAAGPHPQIARTLRQAEGHILKLHGAAPRAGGKKKAASPPPPARRQPPPRHAPR